MNLPADHLPGKRSAARAVYFTLCTIASIAHAAENLPITTNNGEIGQLLKKWYAEGTAAGNFGDYYDNRDGKHSDLNTTPYPQLQRIPHPAKANKGPAHWGAQRQLMPGVVFGNSSTSAPRQNGGSNIRQYYTAPQNIQFLYRQYTANNLYIYPEHQDHDPEHGDVFATNTPYLIASQGSSGSDRPFMTAIPHTLAAFRPVVKRRLIKTGTLMPTLQMILRSTNKHLDDPAEYITGKAHPTVFEGKWVDPLAMVKKAHGMTIDRLPPMIQLKVLEENPVLPGVDFFDPLPDERLADTPCAIARVFRGPEQTRRMVISAEKSADLNGAALTYTWVVLRGDEKRIQIKPLNESGSRVELIVPYHPRRPISPGSNMHSSRVDIGAFVHNGHYYSAPGFITWFCLDNEGRHYNAEGQLIERAFGMGQPEIAVTDWAQAMTRVHTNAALARTLGLEALDLSALEPATRAYQALTTSRDRAKAEHAEAVKRKSEAAKARDDAKREVDKNLISQTLQGLLRTHDEATIHYNEMAELEKAARKHHDQLRSSCEAWLDEPRAPFKGSVRQGIMGAINRAINDPNFITTHRSTLIKQLDEQPGESAAIHTIHKQLNSRGIATAGKGPLPDLTLLADRPTAYERSVLRHYHATVLKSLYFKDAISVIFKQPYTDARITRPKFWRDHYHYDADGTCTGWTRWIEGQKHSYTADGKRIAKDGKPEPIIYRPDPAQKTTFWKRPLVPLPAP